MKVRYVGPYSSIQIAATGQTVERGGTVEVHRDLARTLTKQSVWEKVTTKTEEKET